MSSSKPAPTNRVVAFLLGFVGLLLFALFSVMAVGYYRDNGQGYEDARSKARKEWRAASDAAQATIAATAWKDEAKGLVQVSANAYLPLAAKALVSAENAPRPMQGDSFIVPGTPTFEAFAAQQAAGAAPAAPAPAPATPAPAAPNP